jgi:hypothetical protein
MLVSQSRTAARKELLDQATSPDECEKLYEESLWCLYTLQDDLQQDNPFMEEDRNTIATCEFPSFLLDIHVTYPTGFFRRDNKDQAPPCSMSSPDGHERQGSHEGRTRGSESCRCEISTTLGSTGSQETSTATAGCGWAALVTSNILLLKFTRIFVISLSSTQSGSNHRPLNVLDTTSSR